MEPRKLTEKEIKKISTYLKDEARLNRAVASTLSQKRQSYIARAAASGDIKIMRDALIRKVRAHGFSDKVMEMICKGYEWCKKRHERAYNAVTALVQILLPLLSPMAGAIASIIFIIKHGSFDYFCDCPPPSKIL